MSSYRHATHVEMAEALTADPALPMLDLRRNSEFDDGYVAGAKHVPLHELRGRVQEIADWAGENSAHGPVWIYCGSGFRASIGASVLEAAGVPIVHVDDDFPNAEKAGLPIDAPGARTPARCRVRGLGHWSRSGLAEKSVSPDTPPSQ